MKEEYCDWLADTSFLWEMMLCKKGSERKINNKEWCDNNVYEWGIQRWLKPCKAKEG